VQSSLGTRISMFYELKRSDSRLTRKGFSRSCGPSHVTRVAPNQRYRPTWCPRVLCAVEPFRASKLLTHGLQSLFGRSVLMICSNSLQKYMSSALKSSFGFLKIDSPRILNEDPIWWSAHSTTPPPKMWCFLHNFVLPNWLEQSKLSELHKSYPGPSKGYGTKWCLKVSINHPLGFNWHPLEGAGLWAFKLTRYADNDYIYINVSRTTYSNENLKLEFRIISTVSIFTRIAIVVVVDFPCMKEQWSCDNLWVFLGEFK